MTAVTPPQASEFAPPHANPAAVARCANCDTPLTGHFCSNCGAPRLDERPLTVHRFGHEIVAEFASVDSQTMATVRSLLRKPGELTAAFVSGRTRQFLSPIRVYLLAFGFAMLVGSTWRAADPYDVNRIARQVTANPSIAADRATYARLGHKLAVRAKMTDAQFLDHTSQVWTRVTTSPWVHLLDPLIVAAMLAVILRKRKRSYAAHVVYGLHLLAYNILLSIVTTAMHTYALAAGSQLLNGLISLLHWVAIGAYFYFGTRRLYEPRERWLGLKTFVFVLGAQVAMMVVPIVAMCLAVLPVIL
ncbi:MAG: hypothetical protein JWO05_1101 [Gemmatimonadetes bacterium]|nr:hypothetical protein [Gemmatimonadota bacterium]